MYRLCRVAGFEFSQIIVSIAGSRQQDGVDRKRVVVPATPRTVGVVVVRGARSGIPRRTAVLSSLNLVAGSIYSGQYVPQLMSSGSISGLNFTPELKSQGRDSASID